MNIKSQLSTDSTSKLFRWLIIETSKITLSRKNAFILKAESSHVFHCVCVCARVCFGLDAALLSSTTAVRDASSRDKQQQRGEGDQISARCPSGAAGGGKWRLIQAPPISPFNFVQKKKLNQARGCCKNPELPACEYFSQW